MENLILIKFEILVFFLSLFYSLYYIGEKIYLTFYNIKNLIKPDKKILEEKQKKLKKIIEENKNNSTKKKKKIKKLSVEQKKKIKELIKRVEINITKGYFDTAKALLIEGLAIDKYNLDLNLGLANLYEKQKNYKKAEIIYKDLLEHLEEKSIILKKLGYNLAIQGNFKESLIYFKEYYEKNKNDLEVIEALADLLYELKDYKKALNFIKKFLRENPRNTEKMKMKAYCFEVLGQTKEALETYNKILELQPYNSQIQEKVKHLEGLE